MNQQRSRSIETSQAPGEGWLRKSKRSKVIQTLLTLLHLEQTCAEYAIFWHEQESDEGRIAVWAEYRSVVRSMVATTLGCHFLIGVSIHVSLAYPMMMFPLLIVLVWTISNVLSSR